MAAISKAADLPGVFCQSRAACGIDCSQPTIGAVEEGPAVISIDNRIAEVSARRFADETFLVMVHGLMCWLAGKRIALTQAEFAHSKPPHAPEYAVMYSQHLRFDARRTAIRFDAKL